MSKLERVYKYDGRWDLVRETTTLSLCMTEDWMKRSGRRESQLPGPALPIDYNRVVHILWLFRLIGWMPEGNTNWSLGSLRLKDHRKINRNFEEYENKRFNDNNKERMEYGNVPLSFPPFPLLHFILLAYLHSQCIIDGNGERYGTWADGNFFMEISLVFSLHLSFL